MRVVLTEKPSVARDLARVLGANQRRDGYLEGAGLKITWCFGHLCELVDPAHYDQAWRRWSFETLPMLPERFQLRLREGVEDHWRTVQRLLTQEAEEVVNACDAGREGELIFRYVYDFAGCSAPVKRLWVSSLTDQAIQQAWGRLRPGADFDDLADAARSRSEADWIVGLNATRAMTCLARKGGGEQLLSVGRVQTPTLAMIVDRDREIRAFKPETFWQVKATFSPPVEGDEVPHTWVGTWFQGKDDEKSKDDEVPTGERLSTEADALAIADAVREQKGTVALSQKKRKRDRPPLLYDLTSLQRRANQRYGFNAQRTLDIAQALYEKHKLITYPRTDSRFITADQVPTLPGVVQGIGQLSVYAPFAQQILANPIQPGKRVVNPKEVGDHHAILPTGKTPNSRSLSPDEKRVFDLVARRFLAALSDDALFDITTLITEIDPAKPVPEGIESPLRFKARGRICVQEGWRAVDPPKKSKQVELPLVTQGEEVDVIEVDTPEGSTRPPRPHTDASILRAMETAGKELDDKELMKAMRGSGLGTPATRANILQTLERRRFVERQGKSIHATKRGESLIDAVPVEELKSAELTGRWESRLSDLAEGNDDRAAFMNAVSERIQEIVDAIEGAEPPPPEASDRPKAKPIGDCPVCGKPVRDRKAVFGCDTGRDCAFVVFKTMSGRKISKRMVQQLLSDGESQMVKGFRSKRTGKEFSAALVVEEDGRVGFKFPERAPRRGPPATNDLPPPMPPGPPPASSATPAASEAAEDSPTGEACPACGRGRLIAGRSAWGCSRWRDGCRFTISFAVGPKKALAQLRQFQ